jgi:D-arabinose 1-dehydrogenase-like Zn-dependent alcohol dehydrogenase
LKKLGESCVLEDRACTECGECDRCDLDPTKLCDNCCQCIETTQGDFAEIGIDDVLLNVDMPTAPRRNRKGNKYEG